MFTNDKEIAILLATYNSKPYINEILDSLFKQSIQNWTLYVRDDCSKDNTLELITEYSLKYPKRIIIIQDNKGSLGSYLNFIELLFSVESQYYMFCDHDDIWLPDKVKRSYIKIKELENNTKSKPIIVHTDLIIVNNDLKKISSSFWHYSRLLPNHVKFKELAVCQSINGNTMIFNQSAKYISKKNIQYCNFQDILVSLSVAAENGIIEAIQEPTILYRQHNSNVVGANKVGFVYYLKKILSIKQNLKRNNLIRKRLNNIKKISFLDYYMTKIKIFIYRIKL